jgi:hypothetical protein
MSGKAKRSGEFELIAKYFAPLRGASPARSVSPMMLRI